MSRVQIQNNHQLFYGPALIPEKTDIDVYKVRSQKELAYRGFTQTKSFILLLCGQRRPVRPPVPEQSPEAARLWGILLCPGTEFSLIFSLSVEVGRLMFMSLTPRGAVAPLRAPSRVKKPGLPYLRHPLGDSVAPGIILWNSAQPVAGTQRIEGPGCGCFTASHSPGLFVCQSCI